MVSISLKQNFVMFLASIFTFMPLMYIILVATNEPTEYVVPCTYEDASGPQQFPCIWDADTRGNGKGSDVLYESPSDFYLLED